MVNFPYVRQQLFRLGRMLIAREEHDAAAGQTRRKAA
jgi:hypothetical protein